MYKWLGQRLKMIEIETGGREEKYVLKETVHVVISQKKIEFGTFLTQ